MEKYKNLTMDEFMTHIKAVGLLAKMKEDDKIVEDIQMAVSRIMWLLNMPLFTKNDLAVILEETEGVAEVIGWDSPESTTIN